MTASFETTPIVVNGVMYITTPVVDRKMMIMAVNAATGDDLGCDLQSRASRFAAAGQPRRSGRLRQRLRRYAGRSSAGAGRRRRPHVWDTTIVRFASGYSETLAPQIFDGMVIVGSAGGEWALRGFVAAYDAQTGQQRWRWMATDPKTYAGNSWQSGGGMVWTTPAIDPQLGLVIFSTGNPNPDLDGTIARGQPLHRQHRRARRAQR